MEYLEWKDLTKNEKKQARNSYAYIRSMEEERKEEEIDTAYVECCSFEREKDGYIMVWI